MRYLFVFAFLIWVPSFAAAQSVPDNGSGQTLHARRAPVRMEMSNSSISLVSVPSSMSSEWRRWESILNSTKSNHFSGEMTAKKLVEELIEIGLPVVLDQSASDDSLPDDEPIRFGLPDRSIRTRLLVALREKNACIAFRREHISIISLDEAEDASHFMIVTYDVSGFGVDPQQLLESIQNTIQPDSWQDTGQGLGTLAYISVRGKDLFTIGQTYENHLAIQDFLDGVNRLSGRKQVRNKHPKIERQSNYGAGATSVSATNSSQNNGRMFGGGRNR